MRLIYPALAQILWTFIVIFLAGRIRVAALKAREVKLSDIVLDSSAWPPRIRAYGNNMNNQFETPVLFYALIGIATYVGATSWAMVALAWGYVATRIIHTLIHTGANNLFMRFRVFVVGLFLLIAMWAGIVLRLAGIG